MLGQVEVGLGCTNFVKINPSGQKTVLGELCLGQVDNIWAVTSSTGNPSMTMDNAKQRMRERMVADNKSFASYMEVRKSCWIIEERRGQFFCDYPLGFKGHMYKVIFNCALIFSTFSFLACCWYDVQN